MEGDRAQVSSPVKMAGRVAADQHSLPLRPSVGAHVFCARDLLLARPPARNPGWSVFGSDLRHFHDCTHGSFFKSRLANEITGFLTGVLTFTPYHHWRWEHAIHHSAAGDLDRRGMGDVWTLTVQEYLASSRGRRFAYRLSRNPVVLFALAPLVLFLVLHRFPSKKASLRERRWLYATNLAILLLAIGLSLSSVFSRTS